MSVGGVNTLWIMTEIWKDLLFMRTKINHLHCTFRVNIEKVQILTCSPPWCAGQPRKWVSSWCHSCDSRWRRQCQHQTTQVCQNFEEHASVGFLFCVRSELNAGRVDVTAWERWETRWWFGAVISRQTEGIRTTSSWTSNQKGSTQDNESKRPGWVFLGIVKTKRKCLAINHRIFWPPMLAVRSYTPPDVINKVLTGHNWERPPLVWSQEDHQRSGASQTITGLEAGKASELSFLHVLTECHTSSVFTEARKTVWDIWTVFLGISHLRWSLQIPYTNEWV